MSLREDKIRLRHMLDAAIEAESFVKDRTRADLDDNHMLVLSLVKLIEIIGEAASRISEDSKERFPKIPWQSIVAMRNRLIHAYYDVDLNILWGTIEEDIPPLIDALEEMISS